MKKKALPSIYSVINLISVTGTILQNIGSKIWPGFIILGRTTHSHEHYV